MKQVSSLLPRGFQPRCGGFSPLGQSSRQETCLGRGASTARQGKGQGCGGGRGWLQPQLLREKIIKETPKHGLSLPFSKGWQWAPKIQGRIVEPPSDSSPALPCSDRGETATQGTAAAT